MPSAMAHSNHRHSNSSEDDAGAEDYAFFVENSGQLSSLVEWRNARDGINWNPAGDPLIVQRVVNVCFSPSRRAPQASRAPFANQFHYRPHQLSTAIVERTPEPFTGPDRYCDGRLDLPRVGRHRRSGKVSPLCRKQDTDAFPLMDATNRLPEERGH